ncbi:MAG: glycosyltransferase [Candidatus Latescibacter sp.]|nr:glycosyltransferase [Candidatus Latescibacter sp.]
MNDTLKILHINSQTSWGGGESQTLALVRGLMECGQENILFCKSSGELALRAGKTGIPAVHLPFRGEFDIYSALRLRAYVKRRGVNIVHAHEAHAHTTAFLALLGLDSCRLVVSRRVAFPLRSRFSRKIKYSNVVKKIIAVSDAVRNSLIAEGIEPERIVVIRDGFSPVNLEMSGTIAEPRQAFGLTGEQVVISTVGSLTSNKAHLVLLHAAHILVKKHPEAIFLFAGEGEMRPRIESEIRRLRLEKHVRLLGFREDIATVYRASDIYAVSSREEGLCSSILEAMYFRLPVAATNTGGIPELVRHGVNGYLSPVNDPETLAEYLLTLIENPEKRREMGEQSAVLAEQNRMENTVEKTLAVYRSLLEDYYE